MERRIRGKGRLLRSLMVSVRRLILIFLLQAIIVTY